MRSLTQPARIFSAVLQASLNSLASLVFPAPCLLCEEALLTASRLPVCKLCLAELRPLRGGMCATCGRPILSAHATENANPLCHLCRRGVYHFQRARSFSAYSEKMVRAIVQLKYNSIGPLGDWFGAQLVGIALREVPPWQADVVVPVPIHSDRLRERGYNQAELIAKPLARKLGMPFQKYLLVRTRPRPNRLKLTRRQRWETVRDAYQKRPDAKVDKLSVLLVDDVFTTGATLDACARALLEGGAKSVYALTVARVLTDWMPPVRPAET